MVEGNREKTDEVFDASSKAELLAVLGETNLKSSLKDSGYETVRFCRKLDNHVHGKLPGDNITSALVVTFIFLCG